MTLKVTISVPEGQSWRAKVHVQDASINNGPALPNERHVVAPGESKEFYIHSTRSLYVHEVPLNGAD